MLHARVKGKAGIHMKIRGPESIFLMPLSFHEVIYNVYEYPVLMMIQTFVSILWRSRIDMLFVFVYAASPRPHLDSLFATCSFARFSLILTCLVVSV